MINVCTGELELKPKLKKQVQKAIRNSPFAISNSVSSSLPISYILNIGNRARISLPHQNPPSAACPCYTTVIFLYTTRNFDNRTVRAPMQIPNLAHSNIAEANPTFLIKTYEHACRRIRRNCATARKLELFRRGNSLHAYLRKLGV
ncbi:hypothetical protein SDJN02_06830, partial [Cucurbita argyrosperma subsp. argyrosperma]